MATAFFEAAAGFVSAAAAGAVAAGVSPPAAGAAFFLASITGVRISYSTSDSASIFAAELSLSNITLEPSISAPVSSIVEMNGANAPLSLISYLKKSIEKSPENLFPEFIRKSRLTKPRWRIRRLSCGRHRRPIRNSTRPRRTMPSRPRPWRHRVQVSPSPRLS